MKGPAGEPRLWHFPWLPGRVKDAARSRICCSGEQRGLSFDYFSPKLGLSWDFCSRVRKPVIRLRFLTIQCLPPFGHQGTKRGGQSPSLALAPNMAGADLYTQEPNRALVGVQEKAPQQLGYVSFVEMESLLAKEFWAQV